MAYGAAERDEDEEYSALELIRSSYEEEEDRERLRLNESARNERLGGNAAQKKKMKKSAAVALMCLAGLGCAGVASQSSSVRNHGSGRGLGMDERSSTSQEVVEWPARYERHERQEREQKSLSVKVRTAMASLGSRKASKSSSSAGDWFWKHIGNGYYCHSDAMYDCEFWGSPPPPAYPFPPQMPNPPPPPSPHPPPMSPGKPMPPPPPHPMPPPMCAQVAFDESSCTDEVVVKKCTSKLGGDNQAVAGDEKCENVNVPVLGYCSMQSALHKIQCQADQTDSSAHLAQSLDSLCTELPAKLDAVANFTMSKMFPVNAIDLHEAFNSRFASASASATAQLGAAEEDETTAAGGENYLDIFDPDNEHVFRDSIRQLLRGTGTKNSLNHEIAPLGRSLSEPALISKLGGRETCFSVPVDTFSHKVLDGQFEMEWPAKLAHSEYRPSMFSAQLLSPEFVSCVTMNKFELPIQVARGIVDTYAQYFKPIITKSLAQVKDQTCGSVRASRMGDMTKNKDSVDQIKGWAGEGLAAASASSQAGKSAAIGTKEAETKPPVQQQKQPQQPQQQQQPQPQEPKRVGARSLLAEEKKKSYIKTTTQIPTVDLRGAAAIVEREAESNGENDHASLVEERLIVKINNLRQMFEKDALLDKSFASAKRQASATSTKGGKRSLLNVENYVEAMESARTSFTNALKLTRYVEYEAELATSLNFKASFKAANTMFKHGDLFDLTDTGPPVINKEEFISLGIPGVYMKTNLAARFRMPYFYKADVPGEINFHVNGNVKYKVKVSNNTATVEFLGSTITADPEDLTSSVVGSLQLGMSVRLDEFITSVCVGDLCTGPMLAMQQDAYVGFDTFDTNGSVSSEDSTPTCYEGPSGLETTFVEWDYDSTAKAQCTADSNGAVKGVGSYLQVPKSPMGVYMSTLNGQTQSIWHDFHLDSGLGHFYMDELFHTCAKEDDPATYVDQCAAAYLGELPMKPTKSAKKAAKLALRHHEKVSSTSKTTTLGSSVKAAPAQEAVKPPQQQQQQQPVVAAAAAAAQKPATTAQVRPDGVYEKKPDGQQRLVASEKKSPIQAQEEKTKADVEAAAAKAKAAQEANRVAAEAKVAEAQKKVEQAKVKESSKATDVNINAAQKIMNDLSSGNQQKQPQQQQTIKMTPIKLDARELDKQLSALEASMGREQQQIKQLQSQNAAHSFAS